MGRSWSRSTVTAWSNVSQIEPEVNADWTADVLAEWFVPFVHIGGHAGPL